MTTKTDLDWKAEFAAREAEQERAAYEAKMERDEALFSEPTVKNPATEKQVAFIERLLEERELHADTIARARQGMEDGLDKKRASAYIDYLLQHPYKAGAAKQDTRPDSGLDLTDIPAGRYGIPGGDTRLKVLIQKPTGKWDGWTFVKDAAVYGEGKRYGSQRPGSSYRGDIAKELAIILSDPRAAMVEYARLTNTCGNCGLPLEDETSVARGIGPVCAKNLGWL